MKRFEPFLEYDHYDRHDDNAVSAQMRESKYGEWTKVRFAKDSINQLRGENARLKAKLKKLEDILNDSGE